jgi:hypothetical protein
VATAAAAGGAGMVAAAQALRRRQRTRQQWANGSVAMRRRVLKRACRLLWRLQLRCGSGTTGGEGSGCGSGVGIAGVILTQACAVMASLLGTVARVCIVPDSAICAC